MIKRVMGKGEGDGRGEAQGVGRGIAGSNRVDGTRIGAETWIPCEAMDPKSGEHTLPIVNTRESERQ